MTAPRNQQLTQRQQSPNSPMYIHTRNPRMKTVQGYSAGLAFFPDEIREDTTSS